MYNDPDGHCGGPKSWRLVFETLGGALDDLIWHNSQYELDLYIRSEYLFVGGYDQFNAMTVYSWNWERPNQDTSNSITTQDAKTRIEELEGKNSKAHTWDKHSPTLEADQKLQEQAAKKPGSVQTRFTDSGEMVRSIDQTIKDSWSKIQTELDEGTKGNRYYRGESVHYTGYVYEDGSLKSIWGMRPVNVVIWFDGAGGWYLHTAYPDVGEK